MKYTIVLQHDETDCGVACIASIAKYYGKTISFTKIRTLAGTDLMGTSGLGIVRSAIALGFFLKGINKYSSFIKAFIPFGLYFELVNLITSLIETKSILSLLSKL